MTFFLKCPLQSVVTKLENVGTKMFLQIYKISSNFDFNFLICDPTMFPGKNSPNIAKHNRVPPGKGRGDRALILDSPMIEFFPHCCLSFSISAILRGERVVKVGPKLHFLHLSFFHETRILKMFLKQCYCCLSTTFGENFDNIGPYWGE